MEYFEKRETMNNVTITDMKLIDDGFSQKLVDRHTSLRRSTTNFILGVAKRIVPRRSWLELVYAMPHLVLRREILRSFATTQTLLASSANPIWNIFVQLVQVSPHARSKQKPLSGLGRQQVTGMEKEWQWAISNVCNATVHHPYWHSEIEVLQNLQRMIQHSEQSPIEIVRIEAGRKSESRDTEATAQPPAANHPSGPIFVLGRKTVRNKQKNILYPISASGDTDATAQSPAANQPSSTSDFITHLHSHYSSGHTFVRNIFHSEPYPITIAHPVSREPVATTNHRLSVVAPPMSTVIHRPPAANNIAKNSTQKTYGTSYYFNSMNAKNTNTNVLWVEPAPTYHTYPEIEHINTHTEVIKESVVVKEVDSRPSAVTSQSATVDINHLADQVCSSIERKLMIEKERRGLYG